MNWLDVNCPDKWEYATQTRRRVRYDHTRTGDSLLVIRLPASTGDMTPIYSSAVKQDWYVLRHLPPENGWNDIVTTGDREQLIEEIRQQFQKLPPNRNKE